jgi:hypothetical protein
VFVVEAIIMSGFDIGHFFRSRSKRRKERKKARRPLLLYLGLMWNGPIRAELVRPHLYKLSVALLIPSPLYLLNPSLYAAGALIYSTKAKISQGSPISKFHYPRRNSEILAKRNWRTNIIYLQILTEKEPMAVCQYIRYLFTWGV